MRKILKSMRQERPRRIYQGVEESATNSVVLQLVVVAYVVTIGMINNE